MSTQTVKLGLFGGSHGVLHDITEQMTLAPASLKMLEIWNTSGENGIINAIRFTCVDEKNNKFTLGQWGTALPSSTLKIIDMTNVHMTELSGYTDGGYITSLSFVITDATKNYGPFGKAQPGDDTPFCIPLMSGSIVAFFAKADDCLSAIGVYVKP